MLCSGSDGESREQAWLRKQLLSGSLKERAFCCFFSAIRNHTVGKTFGKSESSNKMISSFVSFIYSYH